MTEPYKDIWKMHIPENKLSAYKALIDEGIISNPHVTYNRTTKITTVEYFSDAPHEIVLQELKKRVGVL